MTSDVKATFKQTEQLAYSHFESQWELEPQHVLTVLIHILIYKCIILNKFMLRILHIKIIMYGVLLYPKYCD